ncbi:MAG: hypothetical protein JXR03_03440 [Cyclobacteriaceae bacterium]
MQKPTELLFLLIAFLVSIITPKVNAQEKPIQWLDDYNVTWKSQSNSSKESMPCGGGDIGMNVWVEKGDLLFYIDRSGNIDENDQQRKSGRIRVNLTPNPFSQDGKDLIFEQKLDLKTGSIFITGKSKKAEAAIKLWVEVNRPVVHLEIESSKPSKINLAYESWRTTMDSIPRHVGSGRDYNRWSAYSYTKYNGEVWAYPDHISYSNGNSILFYHKNENSDLVFDKMVKLMRMDTVAKELAHPTLNRTYGGIVRGENLATASISEGVYTNTPFKAWNLKSVKPSKTFDLTIELHTEQTESIAEWTKNLEKLSSQSISTEEAWIQNTQWWTQFWNRSHVIINEDKGTEDSGWQVGRNYQLIRYLFACNAYGEWPTRFNGGLFTFDPYHVNQLEIQDPSFYNPDYRAWGAWTAQNQRLVYWPMLKNGDFDVMLPQFEFYRKNLVNAKYRNEVAWGIKGCSFCEQIGTSGLPIGSHYGWEPPFGNRPINKEVGLSNAHSHYYSTQLEFTFMIHEMYRFTGTDISRYVPFLKDAVIFHFEYYKLLQRRRNGMDYGDDGKLVLRPSHACETYHGSNASNLVAALHKNIDCLLDLPDKWVNSQERVQFEEWKKRVPELSFRIRNEEKAISPVAEADKAEILRNREIPQLYPVFPYGMYALGLPNLNVAINTWEHGLDRAKGSWLANIHPEDSFPQKIEWWGWTQQAIMLARLGLTDEAQQYVIKKLSNSRGNTDFESTERMRFPVFYGPIFDWMPDMNWAGSGMLAVQEMLLQTIANDGEEIRILPAWPDDWDVDYKLNAPDNTIVECVVSNGAIKEVSVFPESREKDLVFPAHLKK